VALRFLAPRPRSEREVARRLGRAGFDEATIQTTLVQLRRHHLVDDAEFAQYWVAQRQTFRPRGPRLVRGELRHLGVAADLTHTALEGLSATTLDDALRVASTRLRHVAGLDERAFTRKLSQFLARRGFDWDTITPVVDQLWRELSTSSDSARAPTA
jgi:regulatory protein